GVPLDGATRACRDDSTSWRTRQVVEAHGDGCRTGLPEEARALLALDAETTMVPEETEDPVRHPVDPDRVVDLVAKITKSSPLRFMRRVGAPVVAVRTPVGEV